MGESKLFRLVFHLPRSVHILSQRNDLTAEIKFLPLPWSYNDPDPLFHPVSHRPLNSPFHPALSHPDAIQRENHLPETASHTLRILLPQRLGHLPWPAFLSPLLKVPHSALPDPGQNSDFLLPPHPFPTAEPLLPAPSYFQYWYWSYWYTNRQTKDASSGSFPYETNDASVSGSFPLSLTSSYSYLLL